MQRVALHAEARHLLVESLNLVIEVVDQPFARLDILIQQVEFVDGGFLIGVSLLNHFLRFLQLLEGLLSLRLEVLDRLRL